MKTILRIVGILMVLLLAAGLGLWLYAGSYIKSSIETRLRHYEEDSVHIGSVRLELFPLGLVIKNADFDLHLPMDSLMVVWQGHITHAEVRGLDWRKAWRDKDWDVQSLQVVKGDLAWQVSAAEVYREGVFKSSPSSIKPDVFLRDVSIEDLDLHLERDSFTVSLSTSLGFTELLLRQKESVQWSFDRVWLRSEDAVFSNLLQDFDLGYASLAFDSRDSLLSIRQLQLNPLLSPEQFRSRYSYRKVQPELYIDELRLEGIEYAALNRGLFATNLLLDSCQISIFQDVRKRHAPRRRWLPSEMVARIPLPIHLDSLQIRRTELLYSHRPKLNGLGKAKLDLSELEVDFYPIDNQGHPLAADINIVGSVVLEQKAHLSWEAYCYADKPRHDFEAKVLMKDVPLAVFNKVLYPSTGITIERGYCRGARVDIRGNDRICLGDLDIAYEDLKISVNAEAEGNKAWMGKLKQGLGNLVLVNKKNSMDADNGEIYHRRSQGEPFMAFWWKGIQTGLMDSMLRFYKNPEKEE